MKYYKVILRVDDELSEMDEITLESAIEDTLEYLPYNLTAHIQDISETNEDQ